MSKRSARSKELWALVLAAGASRRLGRAKQEIVYRGETLLARALSQALGCCDQVMVVLGHRAQILSHSLPRGVHHTINADWHRGMGCSIARGLQALPPYASAALIMLCDQYRLHQRDYRTLIDLWRQQPQHPCAAYYADRAGVPAIFPRRWFARLSKLRGDQGAGPQLQQNHITRCPLPNAAYDLDTPEDLVALNTEC